MEFKLDWPRAKAQFEAFWEGRNDERALIAVTAPNRFYNPAYYYKHFSVERFDESDAAAIKAWWCDADENVRRNEYLFQTTYYPAEALPIAYACWGAMAMCAFCGSNPVFNRNSVWYPKVIQTWDDWSWRIQRESNEYFRATFEITRAFARHGNGRYFAGVPELGSSADLLSLLRGMDDLCMDLYDEPQVVRNAVDLLTREFLEIQESLYEIVRPTAQGGSTLAWMSLWMPGRNANQLACDFSSVISGKSFREFFLESIRCEGRWSEYGTYHLDGPACLRNHLDTLLETEEIKAIEWTPGTGSPRASAPAYIPTYRKILERGKRLILFVEADEVDFLTRNLPPHGVMIKTTAADAAECDRLVRIAVDNASGQRRRL